MSTPLPPLAGHPDRRRLLQAALAVVGTSPLIACQGPLRDTNGGSGRGAAGQDPDEALLRAAARAEAQMVSLLQPLATAGPAAVRRTVQVHEAHLRLIEQSEPADDRSGPGRRLRLGAIAAAEERLARRHAEAAVRASSGQLARLLAGMAAAAAQQADVWRQAGAGG